MWDFLITMESINLKLNKLSGYCISHKSIKCRDTNYTNWKYMQRFVGKLCRILSDSCNFYIFRLHIVPSSGNTHSRLLVQSFAGLSSYRVVRSAVLFIYILIQYEKIHHNVDTPCIYLYHCCTTFLAKKY